MKPLVSLLKPREEVKLDPRRLFTPRQRAQIFENAKGKCELCGTKVRGKWVAGHIIPHAIGGRTEVSNGRVEGVACGCAKETASKDATTAAKCNRLLGKTGKHKPGARVKKIKGRGFDKTLRKRMNGKVEKR